MLLHEHIEHLRACRRTRGSAIGLDQLLLRVRRRGVLLFVSDFLVDSLEPLVGSLRKFRSRGWEVIALHVVHPDEQRLPDGMAFRFYGLEADGLIDCQSSEVRREYQERFARHLTTTRASLLGGRLRLLLRLDRDQLPGSVANVSRVA